ncbi:hypothetical protein [Corynebacterium pygosceleis]|uniref:hypothetical protein n=1 Tax=Corynebacterium pygosceleis TaxID=2800406 RepID=UPI002004E06B|nr:hypothetical protein [Corynebacterium pygosceleis]MCK7675909.1 hypothetical protein [Corynebacterium pygosceleis]
MKIKITVEAQDDFEKAHKKYPAKINKIKKTIRILEEEGPDYPGLHTHVMKGQKAPGGGNIYISYVENKTPSAWRIYWSYWGKDIIGILYIGPHK